MRLSESRSASRLFGVEEDLAGFGEAGAVCGQRGAARRFGARGIAGGAVEPFGGGVVAEDLRVAGVSAPVSGRVVVKAANSPEGVTWKSAVWRVSGSVTASTTSGLSVLGLGLGSEGPNSARLE